MSTTAWTDRLIRQRPTLIEAGDPYTPGRAALKAGDRLGISREPFHTGVEGGVVR